MRSRSGPGVLSLRTTAVLPPVRATEASPLRHRCARHLQKESRKR